MGHDEGRAVGGLDHFGGGEGLARSGDAEQNLMLLAIEDAAGEAVDGSSLVALGLVVAYELEVHSSLYGRGEDSWVGTLPCKYDVWEAGTLEFCTKRFTLDAEQNCCPYVPAMTVVTAVFQAKKRATRIFTVS